MYDFSGNAFCGTFDDGAFELSRNSILLNMRSFIIRGKYRATVQGTTEVSYELIVPKYQKISWAIVSLFAFVGLNLIVLVHQSGNQMVYLLTTFNGILLFFNLWIYVVNRISRKLLDQRFREEFELEG